MSTASTSWQAYPICGALAAPWSHAEAADWDVHIRAAKRAAEVGDIRPPMIVPWALHHHFSRLTFYSNPEPYRCDHGHLTIQDKWAPEDLARYAPALPEDTSWRGRLRKWIKSLRKPNQHTREKV